MLTFECFLLIIYITNTYASLPCISKSFGNDGTVCVCNSTYCDTIENDDYVTQDKYIIYTSSKDGLRMQKTIHDFVPVNKTNTMDLKMYVMFVINTNRTYQTIYGFGTAFTDAAGINLLNLNLDAQNNLIKSYFSSDGIELNFGRVPIGGTDFSTHPYTYDDQGNGDTTLSKFNLTVEDFKYKISIIQRAQSISNRKINLFASAWAPPPWMKTNKQIAGYGFLEPQYYQLWADYHIKFLDKYKQEGLKFWGMSTGNEPLNGLIPIKGINALGWTPETQSNWIANNMGPTLRNSEFKNIKLVALDDQRFLLPWWIHILFMNNKTKDYIEGIAVHWYWDSIFPANVLDITHNSYPEKFIIGTEACVGDKPWELDKVLLGSWSRGEMYISDIIQDLNHWVTGWFDWNYCLNMEGGPTWNDNNVDAPIIVNDKKQEFYKQPMYYGLGHFTKFITEGSKRINLFTRTNHARIESVAVMRKDSSVVVVLFNRNNYEVAVLLYDNRRGIIEIKMTKRSVQTIIYW